MRRAVLTLGIVMAIAGPRASEAGVLVRSWEIGTGDAFVKGTLMGTEVDREGHLRIAPEFRTVWGPGEGIVWAVAADVDGGTFVGLSGPGRLLRIGADGKATKWFEDKTGDMVTAVVSDGSGGAYVGLSGTGGTVIHVTAPGESIGVLESESLYVWALVRDHDGKLWAGTGEPGGIMAQEAGGWVNVFDTGDDPVRCMTVLDDGGVVAGTGIEGRVIRIGRDGQPFVLLDSNRPEIVALAPTPSGRLFALAAGPPTPETSPGADRSNDGGATQSVRVTASSEENGGSGEPGSGDRPKPPVRATRPGGALYRLDPDGGSWEIWMTGTEVPFALALDLDGFPVVATGDRGRVVRLDPDGAVTRVLRFPSNSATALFAAADGRMLVGGAMDARLAEIGPGNSADAEFTTEVLDAGSVAEWGRIRWDADLPSGSGLAVSVRAGNTTEPDETWSSWVDVESGATDGEGTIGAPPARWLQARLALEGSKKGASPSVRSLEIYYQPRNRPPRIQRVAVGPPGEAWARTPQQTNAGRGPLVADDPVAKRTTESFQAGRRGSPPIRRAYESGARTFSWEAMDPDGDTLDYSLQIRREGDVIWLPLTGSIEDQFYSWDGRGLPDGFYRVRLAADDGSSNAIGQGFVVHRVSNPFRLDNTPPSIADVEVDGADAGFQVTFEAEDPGGRIAAVEFALDDEDWRFLDPVDGLADSAAESYEIIIPRATGESAETNLNLRVTDESGNVGGTYRTLK